MSFYYEIFFFTGQKVQQFLLFSSNFFHHPHPHFTLTHPQLFPTPPQDHPHPHFHPQGLSLSVVNFFAHSILKCLDLLFRNRLIHGDIKPENVLLKGTAPYQIKVGMGVGVEKDRANGRWVWKGVGGVHDRKGVMKEEREGV